MSNSDKKQVEKYITEIKELPDYTDEEQEVNEQSQEEVSLKKEEQKLKQQYTEKAEQNFKEVIPQESIDMSKNELKNFDKILQPQNTSVKTILGIPFTIRDLILNGINILTVVLLIILLTQLEQKASELKSIRNENLRLTTSYNYDLDNVNESFEMSNQLEDLFVNESGVINFVREVENLEGEEGAIRGVTFSSPNPLTDRSGNNGLPLIIGLRGNWEQIDNSLQKIDGLPYLFRAIKIDISEDKDEEGIIEFEYGGLLYVKDNDGEN